MAAYMRHVIRGGKLLQSPLILCYKNSYLSPFAICLRFLYNEQALGLDKYIENRQRTMAQFSTMKEKYCARMKEYLAKHDQITVFTEDLKNMVHIAEDKDDELEICIEMMRKFNQQNKEVHFGTFVFGPVTMRMLYYMRKPDVMIDLLNDEKLEGFFYQVASFQIAMDLLFEYKRYQDVLDVFELLKSKKLYGTKFPRECALLASAACYMLNSKESYNYVMKLVRDSQEAGSTLLRRAVAYVSYLALKQNDPKTALEVLTITPHMNYISVRNLRMMALAEMGRLEDIFPTLRSIINLNVPVQSRRTKEICLDTLQYIQQAVDRQGDKENARIFEQIKRALKENNHITETTLADLLLVPIDVRIFQSERDRSPYSGSVSSSFGNAPRRGRSSPNIQKPIHQSPGLRDLDE